MSRIVILAMLTTWLCGQDGRIVSGQDHRNYIPRYYILPTNGVVNITGKKWSTSPEQVVKMVRNIHSSTTEDYAKFLQMYLNGGIYNGKRILSPHTINTIMANQVGDLLGDGGKDYGLAFGIVDQKGVQTGGIGSLGTFDWGGYFNTQYFADPEEKIIGLIFKQTSGAGNGDETGWKFRQMVFALIE